MRRLSLFQKYVATSLAVAAFLSALGFWLLLRETRVTRRELFLEAQAFVANAIAPSSPGGIPALGNYEVMRKGLRMMQFEAWVIDGQKRVLQTNTSEPLPEPLARVSLPASAGLPVLLASKREDLISRWTGVTRLRQSGYWLVLHELPGPGLLRHLAQASLVSFALILLAFAVGMSLMALAYLRRKSRLAEAVLARMQEGDLKARFPIQATDELGSLMVSFNRMADEIEHLVENIRSAERARFHLLQDSSHDLRTPLTALRSLVENMRDYGDAIEPQVRGELTGLMLREVHYLERLTGDLFFLAEMNEPKYRPGAESIHLADLLEGEVAAFRSSSPLGCEFRLGEEARKLHLLGDSNLLRRVFRNALDNASRFARKAIVLEMVKLPEEERVRISVSDDGPGFTEQSMRNFGQRGDSRAEGPDGKLSAGLGTVIMATITKLHDGTIHAGNWFQPDGSPGGARVTFEFPINKG